MSGREWKRGDVGLTYDGLRVFRTDAGWVDEEGDDRSVLESAIRTRGDEAVRPLVVIDPRDADVFHLSDALATALREFADPHPPKPEEPQGLGAVVEDSKGDTWVRIHTGAVPWAHAGRFPQRWADIDVVRVLSEGWSE